MLIDDIKSFITNKRTVNRNQKKPKVMELLIAFLIAFGVVSADSAEKLNEREAQQLLEKSDLQKDYIIWGAEADDF